MRSSATDDEAETVSAEIAGKGTNLVDGEQRYEAGRPHVVHALAGRSKAPRAGDGAVAVLGIRRLNGRAHG